MKSQFKNKTYNFKKNIILILLIVGGIFNDFALRYLTIGDALYWKPLVTSIAMLIFISLLAMFLSYKNRNIVYIILSSGFGLISIANYLYYEHYNSFISFSLVKQLSQIKEMGNAFTKTLDLKVLIFTLPTIVLVIVIKKLKKVNFFEEIEVTRNKKEIFRPLIIGTVLLSIVYTTLTSTDLSRLVKQWNRPYIVEQLGIYSFTTADLFKNISLKRLPPMEEEEVESILEDLIGINKNKYMENEFTGIFQDKDLYVIHYESAQNFAMDLEFEDGSVTPFLNKLSSEGLFFENFYPQHSVGTSSDSEFTFSTSLLPINNGTVFITHANRNFETMQKLLKSKGYYTMSMHGNNGDFWNRNVMHKTLGYDRFFSANDYDLDEEIGLGLSDMSFFRQSIEKIKEIKEEEDGLPIMATLITLTNHYPFDEIEKYGEFDVGHLEGSDIGNYLKSFHYADMALEFFFKEMDEVGLLDNAVVVLYGDHHAKISNEDYAKVYNYNEVDGTYYSQEDLEYRKISGAFHKSLRKTPFIIWAKDEEINKTISTPMGMVDALPTIGNMFGISNPYQLGNDMLSIDENIVVFPDGGWLDSDSYYSVSSSTLYSFHNEEMIKDKDSLYGNESIENTIELSNNIIQNNLIKLYNTMMANRINKLLLPPVPNNKS